MHRILPVERLQGIRPPDRGLSAAEIEERRRGFGRNEIVQTAGRPWRDLALDTARDPMIWFLAVTAVLYLSLGERVEAATLIAAILPLVGMDAFLHRRTRASTEGLSGRLAARATVVRDGATIEIPAVDLVPGDLAIVSTGEPFPADGILLDGSDLQADESSLTGEAHPVRKRPLAGLPRAVREAAVDGTHWGFAGTRLLTGRATLRVALTGAETLYGEIVRSAFRGAASRTPLQRAVARLVAALMAAAAALCVALAVVRLRQGYGWLDALVSAVTLAVAALPEEFPVVLTVFLGVGVYRLARRQALVRRAVCVESIGRVSCICSDKTGTITEGRLRLTHLLPAAGTSDEWLLFIAALASRRESGDPLDAAILDEADGSAARPAGGGAIATFPFTEGRRRETVLACGADGGLLAAMKGSPEVVLAMSPMAEAEREQWMRRVSEFAGEGHRMIGCAWRPLAPDWPGGEPDSGYRFAGLLACEDPVREGVPEAVRDCREAGIHTLMVTGDHPLTARAVAREIGLGGGAPSVMSAEAIAGRPGAAPASLREVDVIARALPAQKLELVRALQAAGEIVAVTGDGVNDVPALQAADIGIAMGERGTRSAREVAAIVLLDDNFRTIVRAIAEGRQLFHNLKLSFQYLLMIHIPLVLTATLIPLAGYPLLYLPVHIVWLEAIIHPTALLVFQDLPSSERLARITRPPGTGFFTGRDRALIVITGLMITLVVLAGYDRSLGPSTDVEHARAVALVALTCASATLTVTLSRLRTVVSRLVAGGTIGLSLLLVQTPALARLLHLRPLHSSDLGVALLGGFLAVALPDMFARIRASVKGGSPPAIREAP